MTEGSLYSTIDDLVSWSSYLVRTQLRISARQGDVKLVLSNHSKAEKHCGTRARVRGWVSHAQYDNQRVDPAIPLDYDRECITCKALYNVPIPYRQEYNTSLVVNKRVILPDPSKHP